MPKQTVGRFTEFVGKRIAARRKAKKMTQTELAKKIGVSDSVLDRMEHGRCNINLEQLILLVGRLTTIDDLLGLPHVDEGTMVDFVNKSILAMSEEELRAWKQNVQPLAEDHRRIFILDADLEE